MIITATILSRINEAIRRPRGYRIEVNSIVPHGDGLVVAFTEFGLDGRREYRCAGFDDNVRQCFDMVVTNAK